ncbi:unnamed protein product [Schistocephalus solidus]|uniref:TRAF-type domain-containing protein n=1 Tax=Schistocephalus solidus TaxID=70667 RepID=A0A183TPY9_SCHSO|nr:unnamed protein product [Schistocephalus solidus]
MVQPSSGVCAEQPNDLNVSVTRDPVRRCCYSLMQINIMAWANWQKVDTARTNAKNYGTGENQMALSVVEQQLTRPKNPHTMLCGHTFCLNPCLAPVDLNQSFVQCPFCYIETHIADLKPGTSMQSSCTEPCQGVDPECITSCPVPEECEHRSDTNCPVSKALESVKEKLACLSTARASLEPLQSALRKSASCKMSLLTEVIAAGRELRYSTYVSLEKVKLLVASTYTEELTRLKKLQRHLLRLKKRRDTLLQTASDMPEELTLSTLKELEQSTRTLIDRAKDIQKSVESIEGSNLDNLELNPKCASIRHQLENLSLVTSESVNVQGQLAVLPTVTETSKPAEQT